MSLRGVAPNIIQSQRVSGEPCQCVYVPSRRQLFILYTAECVIRANSEAVGYLVLPFMVGGHAYPQHATALLLLQHARMGTVLTDRQTALHECLLHLRLYCGLERSHTRGLAHSTQLEVQQCAPLRSDALLLAWSALVASAPTHCLLTCSLAGNTPGCVTLTCSTSRPFHATHQAYILPISGCPWLLLGRGCLFVEVAGPVLGQVVA